MSISVSASTRASFLTVAMLAGWVALAASARAAEGVESDRASSILSAAKVQAFQLKEDANTLESYTRSNATWELHAEAINTMKENVNKMGRLLTELQDNRKTAAPWQQAVIDRIIPVAKELAVNTTATIETLNKNPRKFKLVLIRNTWRRSTTRLIIWPPRLRILPTTVRPKSA